MTSADMSSQQEEYNLVAKKYAERLVEFRVAAQQAAGGGEKPAEALFPAFDRTGLGVAREYERMGNQPVSDDLQSRADAFGVSFEHIGLTLGTVLHGIDLSKSLSNALTKLVRDTLLERKVIFFRDQNLSEDEQVAFGRAFGDLDAFPFGKPGANPYILEIARGPQSPGTENGWHSDVTWMEKPSLGSIAQCVSVPPYGGDTLFADSYAAYRGLPDGLAERLQHLHGINDYQIFLMGRGAGQLPDDIVEGLKQEIPFGVSHPLLRTHPETGVTGLYIHGGFLRHDSLFDISSGEALSAEESKQLVAVLLKQHGRPEYTCRFEWQAGSIAFWDNRAVQHYAASDYFPHQRLLRRVTVSGDKPFYEPDPISTKA